VRCVTMMVTSHLRVCVCVCVCVCVNNILLFLLRMILSIESSIINVLHQFALRVAVVCYFGFHFCVVFLSLFLLQSRLWTHLVR
jgi:hypothetical protein